TFRVKMITEILRLTSARILSQQLVACCHSYCGLPVRGKDMMIYNNVDTESKPLLLTGHHGLITAMTFGKGSRPVLLCSASSDYVIVWDIEHCRRESKRGKLATGTVIGTLLGEIHLSFCFSDERVAACSGTTVYILSHRDRAVISTLTGHLRPITAAQFCPWNKDILVTISEDRTFKVWDFKNEAVCYDSFVLSVSPLVSVLFLEENRHLITGSTAGQIWCFSLHEDLKCHLVTKMDLENLEKRYKGRSGPPSQQIGHTEATVAGKVEISKPILKIASCSLSSDAFNKQQRDDSWLCIGSTDGLYVIDLAISEIQTVIYFTGNYSNLSIIMAGSWSVPGGCSNSVSNFSYSLFTPCLALLEFSLSDLGRPWVSDDSFSVFASSPPVPESPLNAEFKEKKAIGPKKKG
uniref:Uncharacterized protein n=1 Tax=Tetraodon nigroviridis TaxID=99883 RepID=H3C3Y6_TETNG